MADERTCPHCGKPVPLTALGGICPECMLKAGLATQTEGPGATGPHGTKVVYPPPAPAEIASLFPQLEILECLGRGGMGVVYKARQPRLNRLVALKILARDKEQDAQFAERFAREAQALARLSHPNIVTVHDFGEAGGHCYLVMEFVDGLNLRQLLQTGKMKPEQALTIVPKICDALQYAHEQGIVHRDIKPENILLDKQGRVKIADFGIAKLLGDEAGQQTLTGAKDAVGTPHYMAPEQIEKPLTVDHRADIYSLGVVFYEMLTGELPLGKFQPPSQKVQVDVRLDEVVLRTLEKEPERRYQQAGQVKTDVEQITRTPSAIPGRPVTELPHSVRGPAITFGLLYSGFIGYLIYSARELPERMASHFGLDLKADDWMPRSACLFLFAMVPLFFVGLFSLIRILPLPAWCFNLPNRGYWLSPERRAGTAAFIHRAGLWFSCLITGFMTGVQYLTVQANAVVPPHLAASPFLFLIMGFLLATMVFAIHLLYRFVEPEPQTHSTPENPMNKPLTFGIIIAAVCLVTGIAVWSTMPARPDASQLKQAGWQSWQAQQWPEAIAKFQQAVKLAPQDADAWNGLGWATFNSGKPLEAVPAFQKVIALQPDHPAALNGLGQIALAQGRYDEAEKYLLQAAPQAPAAWYGLARLYLLEGKFDQAEKWAQKVVDSGQADELAKRMLQAALAKQLSDGLRLMIQPQWPARQPAAEPAADAGSNPEAEAGAISAAQAWLTFIDQGNYAESWKQAAPFFQRAVTETTWENSMISFRQPLGSLVSRKLKSAQPMTEMPGAPDGRYVVMQFETSFANKKSTIETVTVGPKQDGAWKASGYYIK